MIGFVFEYYLTSPVPLTFMKAKMASFVDLRQIHAKGQQNYEKGV